MKCHCASTSLESCPCHCASESRSLVNASHTVLCTSPCFNGHTDASVPFSPAVDSSTKDDHAGLPNAEHMGVMEVINPFPNLLYVSFLAKSTTQLRLELSMHAAKPATNLAFLSLARCCSIYTRLRWSGQSWITQSSERMQRQLFVTSIKATLLCLP